MTLDKEYLDRWKGAAGRISGDWVAQVMAASSGERVLTIMKGDPMGTNAMCIVSETKVLLSTTNERGVVEARVLPVDGYAEGIERFSKVMPFVAKYKQIAVPERPVV